MIQVYERKAKCCGCAACYSKCPVQAIRMEEDEEGFLYPLIDPEKCIDCGQCRAVCPVIQRETAAFTESLQCAYAARSRNEDTLRLSSSGGVSYELARHVLSEGGRVAGAVWGPNFQVQHAVIDQEKGLAGLQGSKYVQSTIGEVFTEILSLLQKGETVLFTGTPCQVEGLLSFLPRKFQNLITQDLICHGVPSPKIWDQYLRESGYQETAKDISFRDKESGWEHSSFSVRTAKGKKLIPLYENAYTYFFLENFSLRPICFACPFKTEKKVSDLTCADLWGMREILPNPPTDDKGMSLVIANTARGKAFLNEIEDQLTLESCDYNKAVQGNLMMVKSVAHQPLRERFFQDAGKETLKKCFRKYKPKDPLLLAIKKKAYHVLKNR